MENPQVALLGPVEQGGLAVMVLLLMLGMGATLTWSDFKTALRHPKGILVGFLSQFGAMPVIAFSLAYLFELPNEAAIALILIGCTPGGTTSNLYTYYARGDLALSISMTVASTFAAVIMMPILLTLYATPFTTAEMQIPMGRLMGTLLVVLLPVLLGMFVRARSVRWAERLEKLGAALGIVVIVLLVFQYVFKNHELFLYTPITYYAAAILIGLVGFLFGYGGGRVLGLSERQARTVALETGIQNVALTLAIIAISFPPELHNKLMWLPALYAILIIGDSLLAVFVFRRMPVPRSDGQALQAA